LSLKWQEREGWGRGEKREKNKGEDEYPSQDFTAWGDWAREIGAGGAKVSSKSFSRWGGQGTTRDVSSCVIPGEHPPGNAICYDRRECMYERFGYNDQGKDSWHGSMGAVLGKGGVRTGKASQSKAKTRGEKRKIVRLALRVKSGRHLRCGRGDARPKIGKQDTSVTRNQQARSRSSGGFVVSNGIDGLPPQTGGGGGSGRTAVVSVRRT